MSLHPFSFTLGVLRCIDEVRTGQSHRSLIGHTGAINVLQFDENNVITGSGDKTIRVRFYFLLRVKYV